MTKKTKPHPAAVPTPVEVHALSHDGRGIAHINQKATFIRGALPQEKILCELTEERRQYNEAKVTEILTPSLHRNEPPCAHYTLCGGCSLQHMQMDAQLRLKQETLLDQLAHFGKVKPQEILPPLHANELGYRRKARLGVKFVIKKNKVLVGFREKKSNYLADIDRCVVLHPFIGEKLTVLRDLITTLDAYRDIPQIEVAMGDHDTALVFRHMSPLSAKDQEKLRAFGQETQIHIYTQPNPPAPLLKLWPENTPERLRYTLPQYQLEFLFHPLDFTQINLEMNRLMVAQALQLLAPKADEDVLDLFCGIGNFTLPLARFAHRVTGIEGSQEMVLRAQENARHNHIQNVEYHAADLQVPLKQAPFAQKRYHKILLDPPRSGANEILPLLPALNATRIVYVSCNPATLARDAGDIVHQYGYELKQAGIMNMFPHTSHIEAMAVFDKKV